MKDFTPPHSPGDMAALKAKQASMRAEIASARHKLAQAFAEVFGHEGERTAAQKAVMKNLREVGCMEATTVNADGVVDPYATHLREGRRQIAIHVLAMIAEAAQPPPSLST